MAGDDATTAKHRAKPIGESPTPPYSDSELPFNIPKEQTLFDGKYRVLRRLGQGGMGVVLLARDEDLGRSVAIKLIRPDYVADANARRQLKAEARAMASIRHQNIVQIFAFGVSDDVPYLVMEYIDGLDLYDWLMDHEGHVVTIDEAIGVMSQICRGVTALHKRGYVHQDLKPANVLVGPQFRVAVTDFGLARVIRPVNEMKIPIGTPPFTAPEVVSGTKVHPSMAPRVDVYAMGAIAYQLLTGCYMFPIEDTKRLFRYQTEYDPVPPSSVRPELPEAFDAVVLNALHRDPVDRISSPEALRQALLSAREVTQSRAIVPPCVVIADDDPAFLRWLRASLSHFAPGLEILEAADGREAHLLTRRRRPALLICDLQMPEMNGIELTAAVRGDPLTADVPIVVTTAVGGAAEWKTLEQLKADGFLVKPFSRKTLEDNTRRYLQHKAVR